ncbi:MAG: universal stress protein [Armatimonadota bacterium]|nr:universal stress protein [bacterium]MDW8104710.1 universal stress protein [Armatimonadota bacterium]MDW8289506.1 universal stress protein [Armatimonadota bacterium]
MIVEARNDTVNLLGALTRNHWQTIKAAANLLLKRHPAGIIINCAGITECTEEGAETFADAQSYIQKHGARIVLCDIPEHVMEVLRRVPGVRSQLPLACTMAQARASLGLPSTYETAEASTEKIVLLPVWEGMNAQYAAKHALHVARDEHAVLHIVYILLVPQKLALTTPMPEQEEKAHRTLTELEEMAKRARVKVEKRVERCRDLARGVVTAAEQEKASQLVLGITPGDAASANGFLSTVLQKAPCEVMVVRAPAVAGQAV